MLFIESVRRSRFVKAVFGQDGLPRVLLRVPFLLVSNLLLQRRIRRLKASHLSLQSDILRLKTLRLGDGHTELPDAFEPIGEEHACVPVSEQLWSLLNEYDAVRDRVLKQVQQEFPTGSRVRVAGAGPEFEGVIAIPPGRPLAADMVCVHWVGRPPQPCHVSFLSRIVR